jgi:hypothetical protein
MGRLGKSLAELCAHKFNEQKLITTAKVKEGRVRFIEEILSIKRSVLARLVPVEFAL